MELENMTLRIIFFHLLKVVINFCYNWEDGNTYYVDFDRIIKVDGYVYYWFLGDYLKPTKLGILSFRVYSQGDCKLFRFKSLSYSFHKEPMGGGTGQIDNRPD